MKLIEITWHKFLEVGGISELKRPLSTEDPEHPDVKALITMYSLETFLYRTLNFASRKKDASKIKTLGPYAVALTGAIRAQHKRRDQIT